MKIKLTLTSLLFFLGLASTVFAQDESQQKVNSVLEQWHKAAADANFDAYFGLMTPNSIFIGTDATENWTYPEFKAFAKPYFDNGKAWSFTTLERNIFINNAKDMAWFDELLHTQMGICRGSGVLVLQDNAWKIQHYVLSIAIPNANVSEITKLKKEFDNNLIQKLSQNQ
ncbi:nuclear transport factor 2 family protein [Aquimarina brevivitae]|uniref:SnoaL-like protein n=1 Tax=Aquimarina brevivitae TaxID=323412 RepID=A0A4Q7PF60_9FLAO|nr:nuclear transport factor 2 family protein [Aquimarina brevivitae]RZS99113.1 SnoaL-like protein [Aquimarina brevivitae]